MNSNLQGLIRSVPRAVAATALALGFVSAHAFPITGDPDAAATAFNPLSTNAANFANAAERPYVLQNELQLLQVTLEFFNYTNSAALLRVPHRRHRGQGHRPPDRPRQPDPPGVFFQNGACERPAGTANHRRHELC